MQVREFDFRSLDKILPCPFCGGDAELDTGQPYRAINGNFGHRVVVYCTKCDADMGTCVEDVPDIHPNEVIERWNRRAAPQGDGWQDIASGLAKALRRLSYHAQTSGGTAGHDAGLVAAVEIGLAALRVYDTAKHDAPPAAELERRGK